MNIYYRITKPESLQLLAAREHHDYWLNMNDHYHERTQKFRPRLEKDLVELIALRDAGAEHRAAVQLDQQSVGRVSRMDAIQVQQMALAADRQRRNQIDRIRRALSRMDEGEFGYCVQCDIGVPERRLETDPSTLLCVECASRRSA